MLIIDIHSLDIKFEVCEGITLIEYRVQLVDLLSYLVVFSFVDQAYDRAIHDQFLHYCLMHLLLVFFTDDRLYILRIDIICLVESL